MSKRVSPETVEQIRKLWLRNVRTEDIARQVGLHDWTIRKISREHKFPRRYRNQLVFYGETEPGQRAEQHRAHMARLKAIQREHEEEIILQLRATSEFDQSRDEAILRTNGVYSAICRLAAEWEVPIRHVISRWHQVRHATGNQHLRRKI